MNPTLTLAANLISVLLPLLANATSGQLNSVLTTLVKILPILEQLATDLVAPVQNIISQLEGNGTVSASSCLKLNYAPLELEPLSPEEPAGTGSNPSA